MNPDAPTPLADLPAPPGYLTTRGAEIFRELVVILDGLGIASQSDQGMLGILATRLDDLEVCSLMIEDGGRTYAAGVTRDDQGGVIARHMKTHPAVRQRNEAARHCQSLLGQFGLSPATRGKVSAIAKSSSSANSFDEFL